ncbi:MAG: DnaA/Hda family protein [Hyphomicrobiales bacterium]
MNNTGPAMAGGDFQFALDFDLRPAMEREDFLVAPSNEAAVAMIDAWPNWPSPVVILVGPAGSGKSHLGEVWHVRSGARRVTSGEITPANIAEIVGTRSILLEHTPDVSLDERALFHLINLIYEIGGHLMITARNYPARWPLHLPDLATRLKAAPVVTLNPPDDQLLRNVLVKLFADRQLAIDEPLLRYIMARVERSMDGARRLVRAVDRQALATRSSITRRFVGRVMDRMADGEQYDNR